MPFHVSDAVRQAPQEIYRPLKAPLQGDTELSKEKRHSLHLRNRRARKLQIKRQDAQLRQAAKTSAKAQRTLEHKEAVRVLVQHKNVTVLPGGKKTPARGRGL